MNDVLAALKTLDRKQRDLPITPDKDIRLKELRFLHEKYPCLLIYALDCQGRTDELEAHETIFRSYKD